jgi:hypothetical protein
MSDNFDMPIAREKLQKEFFDAKESLEVHTQAAVLWDDILQMALKDGRMGSYGCVWTKTAAFGRMGPALYLSLKEGETWDALLPYTNHAMEGLKHVYKGEVEINSTDYAYETWGDRDLKYATTWYDGVKEHPINAWIIMQSGDGACRMIPTEKTHAQDFKFVCPGDPDYVA